jgi:isopenicillin-N epimerase
MGVNIVARSLDLGPGDEVLTSDHEYGACDNIWCFLSQKKGFSYRPQPIALPMTSPETIVEQFWSGVTPRTRVIYLSHITSATAQTLPVAAICARARQAGILTIVDGAHAPGQIPLDLAQIGADFYTGNCHKWLCSPKGAGFLYARPPAQSLVEPLVVGWGWGPERTFSFGSDFLDYLQWLGTNDLSAYLAVPAAIQFQADHDWPAVRQRCRQLLTQALERLQDLTGLPPAYRQELCLEPGASSYQQMGIAPLPLVGDVTALRLRLYQEYRIEVPCLQWRDRQFIRISIQAYNSQADVDRLLVALRQVLPMGAETYS